MLWVPRNYMFENLEVRVQGHLKIEMYSSILRGVVKLAQGQREVIKSRQAHFWLKELRTKNLLFNIIITAFKETISKQNYY